MITIEVQSYNEKPISQSIRADFDENGGTIGRAPENKLVLLDPERKISRTHAAIALRDGRYVVTDRGSIAPVVLNGRPLGNGREAPLGDGDEMRIAGYTMTVRVAGRATPSPPVQSVQPTRKDNVLANAAESVDATPAQSIQATPAQSIQAAPAQSIHGAPAHSIHAAPAQNLPSVPVPESVIETEMSEPVLSWTSADVPGSIEAVTTIILAPGGPTGDLADQERSESVAQVPAAEHAATPVITVQATPAELPAPATSGDASNDALLEALLSGAGLRGVNMPGGLTPERMRQIGAVMREATGGLLDLLAARALTKREVRADMTVIVAADNNPLKFSPDREAALTHLMVPRGRGFMPPLRAVTDAYDSLRAHQLGFMAGMRSALALVLARFNPRALEERMTGTTMVDSILPTHRKAKLWDLFGELYGTISKEAHTDFHTLFGREFLRAYQAHVVKIPEHGDNAPKHTS